MWLGKAGIQSLYGAFKNRLWQKGHDTPSLVSRQTGLTFSNHATVLLFFLFRFAFIFVPFFICLFWFF